MRSHARVTSTATPTERPIPRPILSMVFRPLVGGSAITVAAEELNERVGVKGNDTVVEEDVEMRNDAEAVISPLILRWTP
jgi:hypothetical protein